MTTVTLEPFGLTAPSATLLPVIVFSPAPEAGGPAARSYPLQTPDAEQEDESVAAASRGAQMRAATIAFQSVE